MNTEIPGWILALCGGLGAGFVFFYGLWLTVRQCVPFPAPARDQDRASAAAASPGPRAKPALRSPGNGTAPSRKHGCQTAGPRAFLWFLGSFLVRAAAALAILWWVTHGALDRVALWLLGFLLARFWVFRATQAAASPAVRSEERLCD